MASIVQGARDDTRKKAEQTSEGSDSTQPQTSLLVPICSGQRACRTAGVCRSGAGLEATRLLAETESRLARSDHLLFFLLRPTTSPLPPRPLYHTLGYANRSTREVIISLLARHNSSFATTPPALAAAAKTRISRGTSQTSSSKHRPSCHLPRDDDCQIAQHV